MTELVNDWTRVSKSRAEWDAMTSEERNALGELSHAYTKHLAKPHYPQDPTWRMQVAQRPVLAGDGSPWESWVRNRDLPRFLDHDRTYFESEAQ